MDRDEWKVGFEKCKRSYEEDVMVLFNNKEIFNCNVQWTIVLKFINETII